jgi:hypothetical protein
MNASAAARVAPRVRAGQRSMFASTIATGVCTWARRVYGWILTLLAPVLPLLCGRQLAEQEQRRRVRQRSARNCAPAWACHT